MKQVTDLSAIEQLVDDIIAKNPDKVEQAKAKPSADRLVRRSGDEGLGRQGQPAGGERAAQAKLGLKVDGREHSTAEREMRRHATCSCLTPAPSRRLCHRLSESLCEPIRRFEPDRLLASRFAGPSTEDFLHKSLGMLNARSRELLQAHACRAIALRAAIVGKTEHCKNPYVIGISAQSRKYRARRCCDRAVHVVVALACASRDARCGVSACSLALHRAKTLVFLPRCSNPNAVLAIPAGTGRYRHSLTARRAAWRRSERRRRSGGEKGREEDQAPEEEVSARRASVFDFERRR